MLTHCGSHFTIYVRNLYPVHLKLSDVIYVSKMENIKMHCHKTPGDHHTGQQAGSVRFPTILLLLMAAFSLPVITYPDFYGNDSFPYSFTLSYVFNISLFLLIVLLWKYNSLHLL